MRRQNGDVHTVRIIPRASPQRRPKEASEEEQVDDAREGNSERENEEELERRRHEAIAQKAEKRMKQLMEVLKKRCDKAVAELELTAESKLTPSEACTIIKLLGLELTEYQRGELDMAIQRHRHFTSLHLKNWLCSHIKFLLCRECPEVTRRSPRLNKSAFVTTDATEDKKANTSARGLTSQFNKSQTPLRLPDIRVRLKRREKSSEVEYKWSQPQIRDLVNVAKMNQRIRRRMQQSIVDSLTRRQYLNGQKGMSYAKDILKRLRGHARTQQANYIYNVERLALMQKNCYEMQRFRLLLLADPLPKLSFN